MNSNKEYLDILRKFEAPCVSTLASGYYPIVLSCGQGMIVKDADGKEYLDFAGGFGAVSVGHSNPRVLRAIREQSEKLLQGMGDVYPPAVRAELCEKLVALSPDGLSKGVILTTGSEAVEVALKLAFRATGKPGILAFEGGYHGQSIGTLAVTYDPVFREPFKEYIFKGVVFAPYPEHSPANCGDDNSVSETLERIDNLLSKPAPGEHQIGSVIIEPVQGRGGNVTPPKGFLSGLQQICKTHNVLLIADEVMTGFGRTGAWFAVEHENVIPDLLVAGKGLGGGLPIGAVLGKAHVMDAWLPKSGDECYAGTFMGHPLSCAAALAVLEELTAWQLVRRSEDLGRFFFEQMKGLEDRYKCVLAGGQGLMVGIKCVKEDRITPFPELASHIAGKGIEEGFIILNGGRHSEVLTLWPPLIISHKDIMKFIEFLDKVFKMHTYAY